jgi:hypothetical protein
MNFFFYKFPLFCDNMDNFVHNAANKTSEFLQYVLVECQISFEILKQKLSTTPVLRGPNWSLPFHICTDASDIALGAVLGQRENQIPYAIYFVSKNLSPAEVNYTVTEK